MESRPEVGLPHERAAETVNHQRGLDSDQRVIHIGSQGEWPPVEAPLDHCMEALLARGDAQLVLVGPEMELDEPVSQHRCQTYGDPHVGESRHHASDPESGHSLRQEAAGGRFPIGHPLPVEDRCVHHNRVSVYEEIPLSRKRHEHQVDGREELCRTREPGSEDLGDLGDDSSSQSGSEIRCERRESDGSEDPFLFDLGE